MPWTAGSALSRSIVASSSSWLVVAGRRSTVPFIPAAVARLLLVADIDLAGRIVAHQDDGQARDDPGGRRERGDLGRHLPADLLGQGFPVDDRADTGILGCVEWVEDVKK